MLQFDTLCRFSGSGLFVNRSAPRTDKRIALQVQILIIGGDTGVSNAFTNTFS